MPMTIFSLPNLNFEAALFAVRREKTKAESERASISVKDALESSGSVSRKMDRARTEDRRGEERRLRRVESGGRSGGSAVSG